MELPDGPGQSIDDREYAFSDEVMKTLWRNIKILHQETPEDHVRSYLYDWAIYLGVLAKEVFEAEIELIKSGHFRACSLLSRSLAEYDVRLRFYVVQAIPALKAYDKYPTDKNRENIFAVVDWDDSQYSLLKKLATFPQSVWSQEHWEAIKAALENGRPARTVISLICSNICAITK